MHQPPLPDETPKSAGRPRDDSAGPALLEAARKLVEIEIMTHVLRFVITWCVALATVTRGWVFK